jgi:hypothetical protein
MKSPEEHIRDQMILITIIAVIVVFFIAKYIIKLLL